MLRTQPFITRQRRHDRPLPATEHLERRLLFAYAPGDHDAYASSEAYRDDGLYVDATQGREGGLFARADSTAVPVGSAGLAGVAQASLVGIEDADDAKKDWRLSALGASTGGSEGGCPPATPNCRHAGAYAESQFFDTVTVGAGTSELAAGTEVPFYLVLRADARNENLPAGYFELGATRVDWDANGTQLPTRFRTVHWTRDNGTFNYDGVYAMGTVVIGQQVGVWGFMDLVAESGGSVSAFPQRLSQATALFNVAVSVPGVQLSSTTGWYNDSDVDDDGLLDPWEESGIDGNADGSIDIDLDAEGADPFRKDVFVEVDAMAGLAPTQGVLDQVEASFADAPVFNPRHADGRDRPVGITLHAILDEVDLPRRDWAENPWNDFDDQKLNTDPAVPGGFGTADERTEPAALAAKRLAYRYCIFAASKGDSSSSGQAEINGNDFMVTLGRWTLGEDRVENTADDVVGGTPRQQAGTFMHELGHTLGLRHGGGDHHLFKPNYHSVMNYSWQTPRPGYDGSWVLDFSRQRLPTLDEEHLDERAGIGGHAGHFVPLGPGEAQLAPERGPVDWDRDGTVDNGPVVDLDINYLPFVADDVPPSPGDELHGHEDWSALRYIDRSRRNWTTDRVHDPSGGGDDLTGGELTLEMDLALAGIPAPVSVERFVVNDGSRQRSRVTRLTVTFDRPGVVFDPAAFELVRRGGARVPLTITALPGAGPTSLVLTPAGKFVGGSLPDGVYDLRIDADGARAGSGASATDMVVDATFTFHRLFGDADGGGSVNAIDLARFRWASAVRRPDPGALATFDYDANGRLDAFDYLQLRRRMGARLGALR